VSLGCKETGTAFPLPNLRGLKEHVRAVGNEGGKEKGDSGGGCVRRERVEPGEREGGGLEGLKGGREGGRGGGREGGFSKGAPV